MHPFYVYILVKFHFFVVLVSTDKGCVLVTISYPKLSVIDTKEVLKIFLRLGQIF